MSVSERFWNASLEEIKRGYVQDEDQYACLLCGETIEKGIVYPDAGVLYEAGRYIRLHIERAHQSVFAHLLQMDKKSTGLSEHQSSLLQLFYEGKSDAAIQQELGIGSISTIRNHRAAFKEKERQAKVFLTLMELFKEQDQDVRPSTPLPEEQKILQKYFPAGRKEALKTFPLKEKHTRVVLQEIAKRFQPQQFYTEQEINQILQPIYHDYVEIRRNLVEYGFLNRAADGSQYWLEADLPRAEGKPMDRKAELKQQYKETKIEAGVYQVKNTVNQKVFITSTHNLRTLNGVQFMLKSGSHKNKALQQEWNEFGGDAFVMEVLEVLERKADRFFDEKEALEKLEAKWLEKVQPFGERGYNRS